MAKSANYFISEIWKDSNEIINLHIHEVGDKNTVGVGEKMNIKNVVSPIKGGNVIYTIMWEYPNWKLGAQLDVIPSIHREHLRTKQDKSAKDNLDNLILMTIFNI